MSEYIRAKHPNPENPNYDNDIPKENLPGCGDTVLIEYRDGNSPPVAEGDVFEEQCPSCDWREARMEVVEVPSEN